jgi:hypothetical protein
MRRRIVVTVLAFGLVSAVRGHAAGLESERIVAHVPFAFEVGGATLPSGEYTLRQLEDLDPNVLELRSRDGGRVLLFFVNDTGTPTAAAVQPKLVFDRYGDKRFLRAVQLEDGARELVAASPDEVAAARAAAGLRSSARLRP